MNYIHAISMALEAAKIRANHYQKEQNARYLEEMCDWLQVANIYIEQLKGYES